MKLWWVKRAFCGILQHFHQTPTASSQLSITLASTSQVAGRNVLSSEIELLVQLQNERPASQKEKMSFAYLGSDFRYLSIS
jgi:hypothetical protein